MTDNLSKGELLRALDWMFHGFPNPENINEEQAYQQIVALIKKPEVTEEWIWKAIDYIKEYPTYHRLEEKLKEAGVEVVGK